MDAEKPRFGYEHCKPSATESWFRYASISERARSVTRPPHLGFLSNDVYTMSDGQGGVGSRFSLRADFCDEVRRSPAEDADRPMYWRPPWLGGAQLENRALPTSTFLVSVRSGLYVRTEPEVHVPQPLA